jgi:signal peptidase II
MQAAGGASLSDANESTVASPGTSKARLRLLFVGVAILCLVADQVAKALAVAHLTPGDPRHLVGSLLRLDLTRNPGAAFSTGTAHTEWFTVLAIVATLVAVWYGLKAGTRTWAVALGVLVAGIVGNLVDRVVRAPGSFRGHVVDFLELPHWPIFNLADVCITVAAILILLQAARGERLGGGRDEVER